MLKPKYPKHALGQNFLQDLQVVAKIIAALDPKPNDNLLEIGPGTGALTARLLAKVNKLKAVELDASLAPLLKQNLGEDFAKLELHLGDILTFNLDSLGPNLRIVSNLPYQISTPLIFKLGAWQAKARMLEDATPLIDVHLMLQQEVADRLVATGGANFGRLSVMAQYYFDIAPLFTVPPSAFWPQPKVFSSVVRLVPKPISALTAKNLDHLAQLVQVSFSARRKTMRNALSGYFDASDWQRLAIDPQRRPERFSVAEYIKLSNYYTNKIGRGGRI